MAVSLSPVLRQKFTDSNGNPLAGGKLYTYQSGTTTPQATYTDSSGATPNANPVILDSNGEASVWLDITLSYKFVLKDSSDVTQWTTDGVIGLATVNTIGTASIIDSSITTAKIADDAVTAAKLADDASIDANRAVTANHLRNGIVNRDKLDSSTTTNPRQMENVGIVASVASNAMTITLKSYDGSDLSSTNFSSTAYRSSTATSGTYSVIKRTANISTVISSGSTGGSISGQESEIHVYTINNAGTEEVAWAGSRFVDEGSLVSTTAEGGGGAADSKTTLYSTTARSNVAVRYVGVIRSTQATAGTWATSPSEISITNQLGTGKQAVVLCAPNGYGSTNTRTRRYSTVVLNVGSALTLTQSATLGDSITVNVSGMYGVFVSDARSTGPVTIEVSKNNVTSGTAATEDQVLVSVGTTGSILGCGTVAWFNKGDVLRSVHSSSTSDSTSNDATFKVYKI